jgi:uncharacterized membrane protein
MKKESLNVLIAIITVIFAMGGLIYTRLQMEAVLPVEELVRLVGKLIVWSTALIITIIGLLIKLFRLSLRQD